MSTVERAPLAPIPGLRRGVTIPPPPQRAPGSPAGPAGPAGPSTTPPMPDRTDSTDSTDSRDERDERGDRRALPPAEPAEQGHQGRQRPAGRPGGVAGTGNARGAMGTGTGTGAAAGPAGRARASASVDLPRPISLSLPATLVARLKERASADRVSQPEVLLDALSTTADQLADLVQAARVRPAQAGLFLRTPPRGPAEPMATLSMRLLARNVQTIDELVAANAAPSRSALCAAALRRYLTIA